MIILDLELQNFGVIEAAHIPTGSKPTVEIAGLNAQGKTTVLNAIEAVFLGNKSLPEQPIREGEREAKITILAGNFQITKTITQKRKYLEIVDVTSGEEVTKEPQKFLSALVKSPNGNNLATDPSEFVAMKPADKVKVVIEAMGNADELFQIERERKEEYDARTHHNRQVKELKAKLAGKGPTMVKDDMPDIDQLLAWQKTWEDLKRGAAKKVQVESEIEELQRQIKEKQEFLAKIDAAIDKMEIPELSSEEVVASIRKYEQHAQILADNKVFESLQEQLSEAEAQAALADQGVKAADEKKVQLLSKADGLVKGLTIDGESILYNGFPFEQASQAEQYVVAVNLAFALNPELKVVLMRNGGAIDDTLLHKIEEAAIKCGGQVWLERPLRNKEHYKQAQKDGAIIIEAGKLVIGEAIESEPAPVQATQEDDEEPEEELPF